MRTFVINVIDYPPVLELPLLLKTLLVTDLRCEDMASSL